VLYIKATNEDFRAHYYGGSLTEDAFKAKLRIEEAAAPEAEGSSQGSVTIGAGESVTVQGSTN